MNAEPTKTPTYQSDPEVAADNQTVLDHVVTGQPLDPEVARRVAERARKIRQEILAKHGVVNVAVDLLREAREEE
jgi:hypothetical protein